MDVIIINKQQEFISKIKAHEQEELDRCRDVTERIGKKKMQKIYSYPDCELEYDYLGFLENYYDLEDKIPKNFTIIDVGCYLGVQAEYFKNHKKYIGLEPFLDAKDLRKYTNQYPNTVYLRLTAADFLKDFEKMKKEYDIDIEKTMVICSYVPAFKETSALADFFPYIRVIYPGQPTIERLPKKEKKP